MDLATRLHGIGSLDTIMGICDLFKLLETLDVILRRLTSSAGTRCGNSIGSLNENGKNGIGIYIAMMSLNGMHDNGLLTVTTGKIGANHSMRALNIMIDGLTKVMQKTGTLGHANIDTELGSHNGAELGNLDGVLKHILTKGCAVTESTKSFDNFGMEVVNTRIKACLFARFANTLLNKIRGFVIHLLDARRMDASVCNQVLKGNASGFATHRIKAGKDNGFRSVIDHEVDT